MTPGDIVILIHGAWPKLLLFFWRSVVDPLDLLNQNVLLAPAIEMAAGVAFQEHTILSNDEPDLRTDPST
jgi:hypothetical protein